MHGGRELVFQKPETVHEDRENGTTSESIRKAMFLVKQWNGNTEPPSGNSKPQPGGLAHQNKQEKEVRKVSSPRRVDKPRHRAAIHKGIEIMPQKQQ